MQTAPLSQAGLSIKNVSVSFGGLKAVSNFSIDIAPGELWGLIGPNGAGKTTVFNLVTGVYPVDSGSIELNGKSMVGKTPYQIAQAGITRTFQNIRLFSELTVLENVLVSYHMRCPYGYVSLLLRTPVFLRQEAELREKALDLLDVMGLKKRALDYSRELPYGDQRRLEIARALAASPTVLLLDEPAAGMNSKEKKDLMSTIANIRKRFGVAILLIEHDMSLVMGVCENIKVLVYGELIAEGSPKDIQANPKVIQAYLGVD